VTPASDETASAVLVPTTPRCPAFVRGLTAMSLGLLVLSVGCAQADPGGGPTNPSTPIQTITITAAGVSPKTVTVDVGGRVRFINNDTSIHLLGSDPHPDHTECPEINQVGFLLPGQSRETGNFVQPRACGFHDHERPDVRALQGTITIR
jgi:plastocyanin